MDIGIFGKIKDLPDTRKSILSNVPDEWNDYESIIAEPQFVNNIKLSKIFKNGDKNCYLITGRI